MKIFSIEHLLAAGFIILRLTENETLSKYSWWIVNEFNPATTTGVESIDYNYISGTEITDFVDQFTVVQHKEAFLNNFQRFIEEREHEKISMEFSHLIKWKKYSMK